MQQLAIASAGRGADLSAAIANLEPFAEDANRVLRVLDTQQGAVQQLVRNTGEVFGALSERQGQLQGLIRNSGTVFHTTAVRNRDLEATFRALPTFLDESRLTLNRLDELLAKRQSGDHPAPSVGEAAEREPEERGEGGPELQGLLRRPSQARQALQDRPARPAGAARQRPAAPARPRSRRSRSRSRRSSQGIGRYQSDVTGFLGNVASSLNATGTIETGANIHYIRSTAPLYPEGARRLHPAPADLLPDQPVPGAQQRAEDRQRARHLRHEAVLTGLRRLRGPRPERQRLYGRSALREPRHLRHPPGHPQPDQAVHVRGTERHLRARSRRRRATLRRRSPRSARSGADAPATTRTSTRTRRRGGTQFSAIAISPGRTAQLRRFRCVRFSEEGNFKGWRPCDFRVPSGNLPNGKGVVCVSASI